MAEIAFPNIPENLRRPGVQMDIAVDNPGLPSQFSLLIGQATVAQQPANPQLVSSVARAVTLFGKGSQLASMCERYFACDPDVGELWVMAYNDAGGAVAASGSLAFAGSSPTEAGIIDIYIAGRHVQCAVAKTDSAGTIATNVAAAINAYADSNDFGITRKQAKGKHGKSNFFRGVTMPVTAAVNGGVSSKVDLTANNGGTLGNSIDVRLNYYGDRGQEKLPAGVVCAITVMASGAGDPDISGLDSVLGETAYDFVCNPWSTSTALDAMKTMHAADTGRWSYLRQLYGGAFSAIHGAPNGSSLVTFALTRNDPHMTVVGYEGGMPTSDYDLAAGMCGAFARSSRADPARPVQTVSLPGFLAPARWNRFTAAVQNTLLQDGLAVLDYGTDNSVRILRAPTTYKFDPNGAPDYSFADTENAYLFAACLRFDKTGLLSYFPRAKLADDGTNFGPGAQFQNGVPNQTIATPKTIKAALAALYRAKINLGWVEDLDSYLQTIIVQRRANDPSRVDVQHTYILVGGLRVLAVLNGFLLQSPA
jgi:phage tail sheath gpL-like